MAKDAQDPDRNRAAKQAEEDFADWLIALRGPHVSQAELARRTNLTPGLISNVEKTRRRATDDYLKKVSDALQHHGGWKHMREIRDFLYAQRMYRFLLRRASQLIDEGAEQRSPEVQALLREASLNKARIDSHQEVVGSLLEATAENRVESWDPDQVRRELEGRPAGAALGARVASGLAEDPPKAGDERQELVDELAREVQRLSDAQLHRVLGFVAALPRG